MQETRVQSLGREDPLEKEMAAHSSIFSWKILRTEEPSYYSPWGLKELDRTEYACILHNIFFLSLSHRIFEDNLNNGNL